MELDMKEPTLSERVSALEQSFYGSVNQPFPQNQREATHSLVLGNPSPLGLLGFASASLLTAVMKISADKAAQTTGTFAATAIFLGGLAQILTAIFQLLHNNTHAATAFGLYGFHWLTVGFQIWINSITSDKFITPQNALSSATYSGVLAVMTFFLWIPTLRMNAILSSVFVALFFVFITEIPAAYGVRAAEITSGIVQGLAGSLGAYLALLDLVNESWQRQVLPLFPHKDHQHDYEASEKTFYIPKKAYHKSSVSSIHLVPVLDDDDESYVLDSTLSSTTATSWSSATE